MKTFPKLFGIAALVAVIALGIAFTACGPEEVTITFENLSGQDVTVTVQGVDSFKLNPIGPGGLAADPDSKTITCNKGDKWDYSPGEPLVIYTTSGSTVSFKDGM